MTTDGIPPSRPPLKRAPSHRTYRQQAEDVLAVTQLLIVEIRKYPDGVAPNTVIDALRDRVGMNADYLIRAAMWNMISSGYARLERSGGANVIRLHSDAERVYGL